MAHKNMLSIILYVSLPFSNNLIMLRDITQVSNYTSAPLTLNIDAVLLKRNSHCPSENSVTGIGCVVVGSYFSSVISKAYIYLT